MISIDTNVLIRILIDDQENMQQCEAARDLARAAKQVYIPQIVQVESVWVLETAYKTDKEDILGILEHLYANSAFILQHADIFFTALETFRNSHAGFADCLILTETQQVNGILYTFDKKFSNQTKAKFLKYK